MRWSVPGSNSRTSLSFPSWSPDGSLIAFVVARMTSHVGILTCTIEVATPSGHGHRELFDAGRSEWGDCPRDLAWSPDGSRLVFSTGDGVMTFLSDGTYPTTLVSGGYAAWSPDGSRIAFVRGRALFTMAADGTDVRRVGVGLPVHDPERIYDVPSEFVFLWGPG